MKWINVEQQVTVTIYDEEHEEHLDKIMTVEEMLDTYANEGCPTIYSEPERKTGRWIKYESRYDYNWICSECDSCSKERTDYCPDCGSFNGGEE